MARPPAGPTDPELHPGSGEKAEVYTDAGYNHPGGDCKGVPHVAPRDKGPGNGVPDPATMAQDATDAKRAPRDPGATMGAQVENTP